MKSAENAAKNVIPLPPGPNRRDKHELAFLPAALEIVETPPFLDEQGNAIRAVDDVLTDMRWQQLVTDDAVNHRADVALR